MQNAPREHSAMLSTFIKLPFVIKTSVLSIFEWPFKTGFTVLLYIESVNISSLTDLSGLHQNGLHIDPDKEILLA